jgi:hypothetical protein
MAEAVTCYFTGASKVAQNVSLLVRMPTETQPLFCTVSLANSTVTLQSLLFGVQYRLAGPLGRPGSSVGIATDYGLDGLGIESRWGARFSAPVQTDPGAHPASCTMGTGSFLGVKRPGRGVNTPLLSVEVKERVELYI